MKGDTKAPHEARIFGFFESPPVLSRGNTLDREAERKFIFFGGGLKSYLRGSRGMFSKNIYFITFDIGSGGSCSTVSA